jgi:hypothetical protein
MFLLFKKINNAIHILNSQWSGCRDLNSGPPAPKAGALPTAPHPDHWEPILEIYYRAGARTLPRQWRGTHFATALSIESLQVVPRVSPGSSPGELTTPVFGVPTDVARKPELVEGEHASVGHSEVSRRGWSSLADAGMRNSTRETSWLRSTIPPLVPGARIELATPASSGQRSTIELPRHGTRGGKMSPDSANAESWILVHDTVASGRDYHGPNAS